MPEFGVTQYFTYADRFTVWCDDPHEATDLVAEWYDEQATCFHGIPDPDVAPRPPLILTSDGYRAPFLDPDVAPRVWLDDANEYIDTDGIRARDAEGDTVLDAS